MRANIVPGRYYNVTISAACFTCYGEMMNELFDKRLFFREAGMSDDDFSKPRASPP